MQCGHIEAPAAPKKLHASPPRPVFPENANALERYRHGKMLDIRSCESINPIYLIR
jgi:hypothetical protein